MASFQLTKPKSIDVETFELAIQMTNEKIGDTAFSTNFPCFEQVTFTKIGKYTKRAYIEDLIENIQLLKEFNEL